jgi:dienelactone hydrolase
MMDLSIKKNSILFKLWNAALCVVILLSFAVPNANAQDPFTTYLNTVPTVIQTISTTNSGSGSTAITVKRFTFSAKDGVDTVFAIMAYPQTAGVYPGIMFNHGGGGNAETQAGNVQTFAARGYVTITLDLPSIAGTTNTPNSKGPWKSAPAGEGPRLNVTGGAQNSTLCDAVVAGLEAFNYLRSQSNVDANSMAISGSSWGGYMTTMLSGLLGNKVKAAYSVYGCGYYDAGSFWSSMIAAMSTADRNVWLTYLDAGRRASNMTAPYFIEEPSNDTYFWPEAVAGTFNAISGTKNRVCMANRNHTSISASGTMKQIYMDYYLKGTGSPFGYVNFSSSVPQTDGSLQVNMNVSLPAEVSVDSVKVYYSVPTATWQTRTWIAIDASLVSGTAYRATLPASLVSQGVNYYGALVDSRTVQTSSAMYKTNASPSVYLDNCDANTGWSSANTLSVYTADKKEGTGCLQSTGSGTDEFKKVFAAYNTGATAATGTLQFWYYVSDITKFNTANQIELGSAGKPDVNEYSWTMGTLVNGWNLISKTFSTASVTGGAPDLNAINWFRIYHSKSASVTTQVDAIQIIVLKSATADLTTKLTEEKGDLSVYPNPASSMATIQFNITAASEATIGLYDIQGKLFKSIKQGMQPAGQYQLNLDVSGLNPGLYMIKVSTQFDSYSKRMEIVK